MTAPPPGCVHRQHVKRLCVHGCLRECTECITKNKLSALPRVHADISASPGGAGAPLAEETPLQRRRLSCMRIPAAMGNLAVEHKSQ